MPEKWYQQCLPRTSTGQAITWGEMERDLFRLYSDAQAWLFPPEFSRYLMLWFPSPICRQHIRNLNVFGRLDTLPVIHLEPAECKPIKGVLCTSSWGLDKQKFKCQSNKIWVSLFLRFSSSSSSLCMFFSLHSLAREEDPIMVKLTKPVCDLSNKTPRQDPIGKFFGRFSKDSVAILYKVTPLEMHMKLLIFQN